MQRVTRAKVTVGFEVAGEIKRGLVVLLGVARDDSEADADYLASKIASLRIFDDSDEEDELVGKRCRRWPVGDFASSHFTET